MRFRILIAVVLAVVGGLLAYHFLVRIPSAGRSQPNLILISLDTLRSDRLSGYGYSRDTSPFLDRLAQQQGVLFEKVVSVSSWTLPTHVTMFTGLYPTSHGVVSTRKKIPSDLKTMAALLQEQGYETFAFTGGTNVSARFGLGQGFSRYDEDEVRGQGLRRSISLAREKIDLLRGAKPFFLFLHTFDVHCPYNPPEPYFSMYHSKGAKEIMTEHCPRYYKRKMKFTKENALYWSDRYDGSIRATDDTLQDLFSYLQESGLLGNTVVVITSDHGEEFWEYGRIGHGHSLNGETLFVPLVIVAPGFKPRRVSSFVSIVDLFPTMLELLNLSIPPTAQGYSLVPLMAFEQGMGSLRTFQFSELDRGRHLRSHTSREGILLFDLKKKQEKISPFVGVGGSWNTTLARQELNQFLADLSRKEAPKAPRAKRQDVEKLKALGYL